MRPVGSEREEKRMIQEIKMPAAGQTTDEATIVKVNVKVGDTVKRGDELLEAETDKAILPVESFAAGEVLAVLVQEGDEVTAGTVLVAIGRHGEQYQGSSAPAAAESAAPPAHTPVPAQLAGGASVGQEIRMPSAGQTTDEATIVKVNVKVGDLVKRGDELLEVETDKAILPVESFLAGQVFDVLVSEGDIVTAGSVLAVIGKAADAASYHRGGAAGVSAAAVSAPAEAPAVEQEEYLPIIKGQSALPAASAEAPVTSAAPAAHLNLPAMPNAKMVARELGVDITTVSASNGVFVKRCDVELAAQTPRAVPAPAETVSPAEAEYEVMPMTRIRAVIGRRMQESMQNIPAWQCTVSVDMTACMALRDTYKAKREVKISYNDIMAKAIAVASWKFPLVRARYEEDEVRIYRHANVGLAVGLDGALVVPVVKGVDGRSLEEIAAAYKDVIQKARNNHLTPSEMGCGSITISNLGMYDVDRFIAIVNPPESCILAVGRIEILPVWNGTAFQPVPKMTITGSFDHRIIDGVYGAQFLQELKILMENPSLLLG